MNADLIHSFFYNLRVSASICGSILYFFLHQRRHHSGSVPLLEGTNVGDQMRNFVFVENGFVAGHPARSLSPPSPGSRESIPPNKLRRQPQSRPRPAHAHSRKCRKAWARYSNRPVGGRPCTLTLVKLFSQTNGVIHRKSGATCGAGICREDFQPENCGAPENQTGEGHVEPLAESVVEVHHPLDQNRLTTTTQAIAM